MRGKGARVKIVAVAGMIYYILTYIYIEFVCMVSKGAHAGSAAEEGILYCDALTPIHSICVHNRLKQYCKECGGSAYFLFNTSNLFLGFVFMENTNDTANSASRQGMGLICSAVYHHIEPKIPKMTYQPLQANLNHECVKQREKS